MTDVHEPEIRSYNMSRIHSKDTKPEMAVRRFLFCQGFRYRLHVKHLPGTPDIVLPKYNTVVFVNGCFWHGHKRCKAAKLPETRKVFWANKINLINLLILRSNSRVFSQRYLKNLVYLLGLSFRLWFCLLSLLA